MRAILKLLFLVSLFLFVFVPPAGASVQTVSSVWCHWGVASVTVAYDGDKSVFDGRTQSKSDYDRSWLLIKGEKGNQATGSYAFFVGFPKLVAADKTVDLYRAVGVREFENVMANKAFIPGGNSMSARQFSFSLDEAIKFADADPSKVAIIKATVPESLLPKLDFSKTIDPFIFKKGVITVHPEMQPAFNQSLKAVEHAF